MCFFCPNRLQNWEVTGARQERAAKWAAADDPAAHRACRKRAPHNNREEAIPFDEDEAVTVSEDFEEFNS